ncbi:hypothetical protein quinque_010116 [Culex quinquefasciatus]
MARFGPRPGEGFGHGMILGGRRPVTSQPTCRNSCRWRPLAREVAWPLRTHTLIEHDAALTDCPPAGDPISCVLWLGELDDVLLRTYLNSSTVTTMMVATSELDDGLRSLRSIRTGKDDGDPQAECVFRCRLALGAKSMATPGDSRQPEVPVNDADDHSGRLGSGVSCRLFRGVGAEDGDVHRLVTPEVPSAVQEGSRPVSRCQTMSTCRLKLRGHFLRELVIRTPCRYRFYGGTRGRYV